MGRGEKKPLYRRVNTRAYGVLHRADGGPKARDFRGTMAAQDVAHPVLAMPRGLRHGLDYTPLYRFLLSRVGQPWAAVHSEAMSRLDEEAPIFHLVTEDPGAFPLARVGESSYFSRLTRDGAGLLVRVDPSLEIGDLYPVCACCTHTFNGARFRNRFDPAKPGLIHR